MNKDMKPKLDNDPNFKVFNEFNNERDDKAVQKLVAQLYSANETDANKIEKVLAKLITRIKSKG